MSAHTTTGVWVPNAAALLTARPELAGVGLTAAVEAVTAA